MRVKKAFCLKDNKINEITLGNFEKDGIENPIINVTDIELSKIAGFGGAITEATAYNFSKLSDADKTKFIDNIFGKDGLNYSFIRLCISSSDFTVDEYTYVENNDFSLSTFSIERDRKYIIPCLKELQKRSKKDFKFVASSWSAPAFMKTTSNRFSGGKLKDDCYEVYAKFIVKFVEEYKKEGIDISYLTIQNEPNATQTWESCFFTAEDEIRLAILIKKELVEKGFKNVKLIGWDHNKEKLYNRAKDYFTKTDVFDGIGFHWYSGSHFSAIQATRMKFPNKLIFETEFCTILNYDGFGYRYTDEYIGNLNSGVNGMIEWNLLLDTAGGPYHNRTRGCLAPYLLSVDKNTIEETIIFKESFMFTHFIEEGAIALMTTTYSNKVCACACKNKNGEYVVCISKYDNNPLIRLSINGETLEIEATENSLYTLILAE